MQLWTRNHKGRNGHLPEIAEAVGGLSRDDPVLDGEVVTFQDGLTSFSRLQDRAGIGDPDRARATGVAVLCYVSDVLHLQGRSTRRLGLRDRKRILRAAAPYPSGRSSDWLKLKCGAGQELVVGGFTEPRRERTGRGALLLGYREDGALRYAGKVGTGFDESTLRELRGRLDELERDEPAFADPPSATDGVHWGPPRAGRPGRVHGVDGRRPSASSPLRGTAPRQGPRRRDQGALTCPAARSRDARSRCPTPTRCCGHRPA